MALLAPEPNDGQANDEPAIFCDINITPLTDVVLVLLVIFMISSSAMVDAVREGRLDLALPQAGQAQSASAAPQTMVIAMATDGRLFVHGAYIDAEALPQLLRKAHQEAPNTVVIVDADGALSHGTVVQIIDQVRAAGFATVGIGAQSETP